MQGKSALLVARPKSAETCVTQFSAWNRKILLTLVGANPTIGSSFTASVKKRLLHMGKNHFRNPARELAVGCGHKVESAKKNRLDVVRRVEQLNEQRIQATVRELKEKVDKRTKRRPKGTQFNQVKAREKANKSFEQVDKNKDGRVSREEWSTSPLVQSSWRKQSEWFSIYDHNSDGWVQASEWIEEEVFEYLFEEIDRDHNGSISQSEWAEWEVMLKGVYHATFTGYDVNKDGSVDKKEWFRGLNHKPPVNKTTSSSADKIKATHKNSDEIMVKVQHRLAPYQQVATAMEKEMAKPIPKPWEVLQKNTVLSGKVDEQRMSKSWHTNLIANEPKKKKPCPKGKQRGMYGCE